MVAQLADQLSGRADADTRRTSALSLQHALVAPDKAPVNRRWLPSALTVTRPPGSLAAPGRGPQSGPQLCSA
jgi:hypothetical protein